MLKIFGIKNCDSVRKAVKFLKLHEVPFEFIDFKVTPIGEKKIRSWVEKADIKTLFNTHSTTYRTLKLKELDLDDEAKIEWLAKENMLIKRPVIDFDEKVIIGYNESEYLKTLLQR